MKSKYFIHPKAIVETDEIGIGTRIWGFTHILKKVKIGEHCNIGEHCFIETGAIIKNYITIKNGVCIWNGITLENGVFIGPNATFTNDLQPRAFYKKSITEYLKSTIIKKGVTIGANSTIVCGNTINQFAFIGAGTVVTKDVYPFELVVGNPAHRISYICICGKPLSKTLKCNCGCEYQFNNNNILEIKKSTFSFPMKKF